MKKMYLYLLTALAIIGLTSSIKAMEIANPPVFLVNNYGANVMYKLGSASGIQIGNGAKIELGKTIRDIKNLRLWISSSGYPGTFTDISDELQKIGIPMDDRYYNAVLTVYPSGRLESWKIQVTVEPREKIKIDWPVNKTLPTTRALPVKKQTVK